MSDTTLSPFRRMPGEWEPHTACLILYPHNPATFRLDKARPEVEQVIQAIANHGEERVVILCSDQDQAHRLQECGLAGGGDPNQEKESNDTNIVAVVCPSNDTWVRDTGPSFVIVLDGEGKGKQEQPGPRLVGIQWQFNAYGGAESGCYWPCDKDQRVASNVCQWLATNLMPETTSQQVSLILEGGSIHSDGEGTILTTEECLLHTNRNPTLDKEQIEKLVLDALGAQKMIWLATGLAFDEDTNGHIDNWACFLRPGEVILAWTDDAENDSENYRRCRDSLEQLEQETDAKGRTLKVHKLHLPSPMFYTDDIIDSLVSGTLSDGTHVDPRELGEQMAASYVNFYMSNKALIVPQYGDPVHDKGALTTLESLVPDRKVVGVPSREILIGGGNIHCITQQVPSPFSNSM